MKALGKLLGKAQTNEEVHDDAGHSDSAGGKVQKWGGDDIFLSCHNSDGSAQTLYFKNKILGIIHRAEALPPALIADVQSPPPDCN